MLTENGYTVAASADVAWAYLLDVEKVAPCIPGAELTETVDDRNWKGKVLIAFGPVKMTFAGTVTLDELDEAERRVRLHAKGTEHAKTFAANDIDTINAAIDRTTMVHPRCMPLTPNASSARSPTDSRAHPA